MAAAAGIERGDAVNPASRVFTVIGYVIILLGVAGLIGMALLGLCFGGMTDELDAMCVAGCVTVATGLLFAWISREAGK